MLSLKRLIGMNTVVKISIHLVLTTGVLVVLFPGCKKVDEDLKVTDIDGNVYNTVTIGSQVWMVENLKTTRYTDGTSIDLITDNTEWSNANTPAYCWNDNDIRNKDTYGALYNWYAVNTGKLCPTGWHSPTDTELTALSDYLGGDAIAGGKLKEMGTNHWANPNEGANNESGFTALPAGYRSWNGNFNLAGTYTCIWSSSELNDLEAWFREIYGWKPNFTRSEDVKEYGFSVRCVKDK